MLPFVQFFHCLHQQVFNGGVYQPPTYIVSPACNNRYLRDIYHILKEENTYMCLQQQVFVGSISSWGNACNSRYFLMVSTQTYSPSIYNMYENKKYFWLFYKEIYNYTIFFVISPAIFKISYIL